MFISVTYYYSISSLEKPWLYLIKKRNSYYELMMTFLDYETVNDSKSSIIFGTLTFFFLFGQYVLSDVLQGGAVSETVGVYGL